MPASKSKYQRYFAHSDERPLSRFPRLAGSIKSGVTSTPVFDAGLGFRLAPNAVLSISHDGRVGSRFKDQSARPRGHVAFWREPLSAVSVNNKHNGMQLV